MMRWVVGGVGALMAVGSLGCPDSTSGPAASATATASAAAPVTATASASASAPATASASASAPASASAVAAAPRPAGSAAPSAAVAEKIKKTFGTQCRLERTCGALWGVDCEAAVDGPYYYVKPDSLEVVSRCGGYCMGGRCTNCPPKEWTCTTY